jgi:hypothetical protein
MAPGGAEIVICMALHPFAIMRLAGVTHPSRFFGRSSERQTIVTILQLHRLA